ncbi:probable DNA repair protein RAD51 homolog 4 isoform X2 [Harmonia axyridis]|uniref:probable DNA repair protein RAD51 homolog 4 isoform X2 n=1 Tax=Harmonia axyridis TaxID=115357 RepID=UPI001E278715|nr:probable DNA repair protein RAD51 homolog 4 isoform X2 [Harmonia axyridis]
MERLKTKIFQEIIEIKKTLLKKYAAISENGYDSYLDLVKNSALIPSGIKSIDEFLEGGFLTSSIYEIYGRAACGKSLLAYMFMKNIVMKMKQICFLLDSKHDFSAEKFHLLCTEYSTEDLVNGLSRISIKFIQNKYDLLNCLQEISENLEEKSSMLRFIVIDSLAAVFLNNIDHSLNNLCLTHLANIMHFITTRYHVTILVINLMSTWVEGDFGTQIGTKQTVSCGRFWFTVPNTRIKLEREQHHLRLSIEKSNTLSLKTVFIPLADIT